MKPTTIISLPGRSDSDVLTKYLQPGEPIVIAKFTGVGNSSPYEFRAKDNRAYVFRWDTKNQGHTLRVPLGLWQQQNAKLAHDLLDERRLPHPMVITLEMPAVVVPVSITQTKDSAAPAIIPESPEMGAADTTPAENVVGLGDEATAAPAVEPGSAQDWEQYVQPLEGTVYKVRSDAPAMEVLPVPDAPASTSQADYAAIYDIAFDLVEAPKRIKALAALIGVEESALREAIESPSSRVELRHAGWVARKESQPA